MSHSNGNWMNDDQRDHMACGTRVVERAQSIKAGDWHVAGDADRGTLCVVDRDSAYVVDRFVLGIVKGKDEAVRIAHRIAAGPDVFVALVKAAIALAADTSESSLAQEIRKAIQKFLNCDCDHVRTVIRAASKAGAS